ncbi:hypothetical protein [Paenibacillus lautus]|uniref:hypothetical protein n=1 Tax=Paenibacillus lautus TaxID=1401 RepID=UPI003D2C7C7D
MTKVSSKSLKRDTMGLKLAFPACRINSHLWIYWNSSVSFEEQLLRAKQFSTVKIVSLSAQDCMPFRDQLRFFGRAVLLYDFITAIFY